MKILLMRIVYISYVLHKEDTSTCSLVKKIENIISDDIVRVELIAKMMDVSFKIFDGDGVSKWKLF